MMDRIPISMRKAIIQGLKLAVGTIIAIALSERIGILSPYATGSIALITLLSSKWDTVRLTVYRLITYFITVAVTWMVFSIIGYPIVTFGIVMALLYWLCKACSLMSTLAVNGVICSHFLTYTDFSPEMIVHEFLIVLIGVLCALVVNQFYTKRTTQKELIRYVHQSSDDLVKCMHSMADRLENKEYVPFSIDAYEEKLVDAYELARDFEENTFSKHTNYYSNYFRMRLSQCHILKNMMAELERMPMHVRQEQIVVHYIRYLAAYITETNAPYKQEQELRTILDHLDEEQLPATRSEFESRAYLFHILMDLREFVQCKQVYIDSLSPKQKEEYWKS
ncbi:aromatic acid exporter family protein [uncultured Dubosiella sp.]|uniref:aromatic acid exporter family protein n=2 Tax=uncultured Dubosiella sp. TaxID=1937011 RepID=UPI0025D931EB|nr:aromatic acid exporter family protein [uncultured Dubosiella sp.]